MDIELLIHSLISSNKETPENTKIVHTIVSGIDILNEQKADVNIVAQFLLTSAFALMEQEKKNDDMFEFCSYVADINQIYFNAGEAKEAKLDGILGYENGNPPALEELESRED